MRDLFVPFGNFTFPYKEWFVTIPYVTKSQGYVVKYHRKWMSF